MKIKDILKKSNELLIKNDIEESKLKSRILLSNILNVKKEYLIIYEDKEIPSIKENEFFNKLERLLKGEPIQYIINKAEFMGFEFYVDSNVLIPQPDTEILVENVINIAKTKENDLKILDLCTGSGVIGISLSKFLQNAKILASDISVKALEVAKQNSIKNNVKIEFVNSNLFDNINERFDIVVSNPPYIETAVIDVLSKEVKSEPFIALDGGKDGLDFYRRIVKQAKKYLYNDGYLALEIGYNQKETVEKMFINNGYKNIISKKDLAGIYRIVIAQV